MSAHPAPTATNPKDDASTPLIALRCDASATVGVGHLMRCVAVAEGLRTQGLTAVLLGDLAGVALAERQAHYAGLEVLSVPSDSAGLVRRLDELSIAALVVDSYKVPVEHYLAASASGRPVVAVVDAPAPDLTADLLVNPNLGAQAMMAAPHRGAVLAGPEFALLRRAVTRRRPDTPAAARGPARRVLVVAGGTDVAEVATSVVNLLLATELPLRVDVVCASDRIRNGARAIPTSAYQRVVTCGPTDDLAKLAVRSDLVVTTAGTTMLELSCLGLAMAVITVADNQLPGYTALVAHGAGLGLGTADRLAADSSATTARLAGLVLDADRRTDLARRAHTLVDGSGGGRVARAIAELLPAALTGVTSRSRPPDE